jgi:cell division protein FtsB
MAELKNPFRGVKVVYTRSHPLTKLVVIALILVCMASMITLGLAGIRLKTQIEALRQEAAQLEAEIEELSDKLGRLDSVEGVEDIAQDELDLVDPDTIVIDPNP